MKKLLWSGHLESVRVKMTREIRGLEAGRSQAEGNVKTVLIDGTTIDFAILTLFPAI